MEMENIRFGKEKGYEGIFTTNANRLTQHISRILGYQILSTIQVKITYFLGYLLVAIFIIIFSIFRLTNMKMPMDQDLLQKLQMI